MLRRTLRIVDGISRAAAGFAAVLIAAIAGLVLTEIVCRAFLNISMTFAWDYSSYFMAVAIFCGAGYTLRTGGHVRVSLVTASTPPRVARGIDYLAVLFAIAVAAYVAYAMTLFAWSSYAQGMTSSTIDATPLAIPQSAMAFGAVLLLLQLIARLVRMLIGEPTEDQVAKDAHGLE